LQATLTGRGYLSRSGLDRVDYAAQLLCDGPPGAEKTLTYLMHGNTVDEGGQVVKRRVNQILIQDRQYKNIIQQNDPFLAINTTGLTNRPTPATSYHNSGIKSTNGEASRL
jgi:hypothetical protein